jgi:hypothetical protein
MTKVAVANLKGAFYWVFAHLSIYASTMVWKSCTDRNSVSIVNKDGLIARVRVVEHHPANASLKIRFHESCEESVIGSNIPSHLKDCICWMSANMFLQCFHKAHSQTHGKGYLQWWKEIVLRIPSMVNRNWGYFQSKIFSVYAVWPISLEVLPRFGGGLYVRKLRERAGSAILSLLVPPRGVEFFYQVSNPWHTGARSFPTP